jgi:hypothetical protein
MSYIISSAIAVITAMVVEGVLIKIRNMNKKDKYFLSWF